MVVVHVIGTNMVPVFASTDFGRARVLADYQRRVFRKRYLVDMPVCNGILPRNNWKKQPAGQDTFANQAPKELRRNLSLL